MVNRVAKLRSLRASLRWIQGAIGETRRSIMKNEAIVHKYKNVSWAQDTFPYLRAKHVLPGLYARFQRLMQRHAVVDAEYQGTLVMYGLRGVRG